MAVRAAGSDCFRVGLGRRRRSLDKARRFDAVDRAGLDYARGLKGVELVVVATPLSRFAAVFEAMAPHLEPGCVVTEVGSTKAEPVRLAQELFADHVHFVGSHPMAGSEKTGVEFSRADLFEGAPCLITPDAQTDPRALALVRDLWRTVGCRITELGPEDHDRIIAGVSHMPHLASSCVLLAAARTDRLDLAGTGLMDATRIASGDPGLWLDIMRLNRRSLLAAIDDLTDELARAREALASGDDDALMDLLDRAKRRRDAWIATKLAARTLGDSGRGLTGE